MDRKIIIRGIPPTSVPVTSVTPGSPWTRFQPVAARVVAEKGQNAPVDSLESLRGYGRRTLSSDNLLAVSASRLPTRGMTRAPCKRIWDTATFSTLLHRAFTDPFKDFWRSLVVAPEWAIALSVIFATVNGLHDKLDFGRHGQVEFRWNDWLRRS